MKFVPYLSFNGSCREAFEFYASIVNGKIAGMVTWGETPAAQQIPANWHDKIINAHLIVGDQELMGVDSPPNRGDAKVSGFSLTVQIEDEDEGLRIFNALSDGGQVTQPFQPTFFARKFGMVTDRYGTPWMVNCRIAAN